MIKTKTKKLNWKERIISEIEKKFDVNLCEMSRDFKTTSEFIKCFKQVTFRCDTCKVMSFYQERITDNGRV